MPGGNFIGDQVSSLMARLPGGEVTVIFESIKNWQEGLFLVHARAH